MLTAGVLLFNASGQIRWTTALPKEFNGGTPTNEGLLACANGVPSNFLGGLGYSAGGDLCIDNVLADPVTHWAGGLPLTDAGRLATDPGGVPTHWVAGIPLTINGRVAIATSSENPTTAKAFSAAFGGAFR